MTASTAQLRVAYFGCIDLRYSRNKTNLDGLRQNGVSVELVVVNTPVTPLHKPEHVTPLALLRRVLHKGWMIPAVIRHWSTLRQCDVILVGYPGQFDLPLAWLVAKLLDKKLVFDPVILMFNALANDIGVIQQQSLVTRLLRQFERWVMSLPELVIASTQEQKDFFVAQVGVPPAKVAVVYLAADDQLYYPSHQPPADDRFRVVYYGLFTPLHGVAHLLDAAKLCQREPRLLFQLVGQGQLYQQARAQAAALQLQNVEFYPDLNESNALTLLQAADVFVGFLAVNPTMDREIPNKVYQGLALGKVVVTGDSPAVRTILQHRESVYLIPAGQPAALAAGLIELAKQPALVKTIQEQGLALFRRHYTVKAVGAVLTQSLREVCRK